MIAPQVFPVTINNKSKSEYTGSGYQTVTTTTILEANRNIQRMMNNRVFQIFGEQKNNKATYVLYLTTSDPVIPQDSDVTWVMHGQTYTGKVKFTQPMNRVVLGRNRECFIQSDNQ